MNRIAPLLLFAVPIAVSAQAPAWSEPPKLVVGIVVDQMRADYIHRYWDNFGEGGFRRLVTEGAHCRDTHYPYSSTDTGPGHASLYTGSVPAYHGITANYRFDRVLGRTVYCVEDTTAKVLGSTIPVPGRSPHELQATTYADELERATGGKAHTIGVSLKDRGAILPIGRTGDAAFWLPDQVGDGFVSSDWYGPALPAWLNAFNKEHPYTSYMTGTWELLLPAERYHSPLPDDNAYEVPLPGTTKASLPIDLDALRSTPTANVAFINTPGANTILTDLALAALRGERMGQDAITDLLCISYSAPDKLGHRMGPLALEIEDMYLRLDRELARLLEVLDKEVGTGAYTVFLTADHGTPDIAAYRADIGASAGNVNISAMHAAVEEYLQQAYGDGPWVSALDDDQLFLDHALVRAKGLQLANVQHMAAEVMREQPGMLDAITARDLERGNYLDGPRTLLARGHHPERGADVYLLTRPSYLPAYSSEVQRGVDHGSAWTYDTHVPLLFFGKGVLPGQVNRRVAATDIVPTLCLITGVALPDASSGVAIPEVVRP